MGTKLTRVTPRFLALSAGAASFFVAASAFASEGAEGGAESAAPSLQILPPMAEFIPALISFAIVFGILSKFAWPAITEMLDKRAETIRESLEKAEAAKVEAERLLEEYKVQMAEARKEAANLLTQARQAAESTRSEVIAKAQQDAEGIVAKAREQIEAEKKAAIAELQQSVADVSVAVAGKLIGSELSKDEHLKVIEKYVAEAGSLNAN